MSDSPTAPREREMSALDQQVAEKRKELLDFATVGDVLLGRAALNKQLDALLTTHRRQVLTEVAEWRLRKVFGGGYDDAELKQWLDTQLLRDTKENDK